MEFWKHRREVSPAQSPEAVKVEPRAAASDVRAAYEKGRREGEMHERRRHRHPILAVVVGAAALIGAGALALSAHEGSFSGGGQVVDRGLSTAASQAGHAVQNAGSAITKAAPAAPNKDQG
jgi:hypothetical protein